MSAIVLDGKAIAAKTENELSQRVALIKQRTGKTPILATILVGTDPASATYVKMKGKACRRIGMESLAIELGAETTTEQLLDQIDTLNHNPEVHGILLQHPTPSQIDERACFDRISLEKDVDGVSPAWALVGWPWEKVRMAALPRKASCGCLMLTISQSRASTRSWLVDQRSSANRWQ